MGEQEERTDTAYRDIGRYVVEFSQLVLEMRWAMVKKLGPKPPSRALAHFALGEATAGPVVSSFIAMCVHAGGIDWDSADGKIAKALSDQLHRAIRKRNDVVHGDWFLGEQTMWLRVDTRRKEPFVMAPEFLDELQPLTAEAVYLQTVIRHFGKMCLYPDEPKGHHHLPVSAVFARRKRKTKSGDTEWTVVPAKQADS